MELVIWNARGVRGKRAELIGIIIKYDIICITETKLYKNYDFQGYTTFRGDREKEQKIALGGTAIIVKKGIKHKIKGIKDILTNVDCSGISITDERNSEINLIVAYRKPEDNLIKREWLKFMEQFTNTETIITGNFNAHNRQWNYRRIDRNGMILEEAMEEKDMYVVNVNTVKSR